MYVVPLQTDLMILGELSKGLMFSLFAVGDVCLASWTRHSFAVQKRKTDLTLSIKTEQIFLNSAADSDKTYIKITSIYTEISILQLILRLTNEISKAKCG